MLKTTLKLTLRVTLKKRAHAIVENVTPDDCCWPPLAPLHCNLHSYNSAWIIIVNVKHILNIPMSPFSFNSITIPESLNYPFVFRYAYNF